MLYLNKESYRILASSMKELSGSSKKMYLNILQNFIFFYFECLDYPWGPQHLVLFCL